MVKNHFVCVANDIILTLVSWWYGLNRLGLLRFWPCFVLQYTFQIMVVNRWLIRAMA